MDLPDEPTRPVAVPGGMAYQELEIPKIVLDADAVIDIANLKTHTSTLASLGAKNLFGVPPVKRYGMGGYPRREFHSKGVDKVIHDICRVVPIAYNLIDGTLAMEGNGPIKGTPVPAGLVVAGRKLIATYTVGCRLMMIDPLQVAHL